MDYAALEFELSAIRTDAREARDSADAVINAAAALQLRLQKERNAELMAKAEKATQGERP